MVAQAAAAATVMVVVTVTAVVTVMVTVTAAEWALAFLSVFRFTRWAITPILIILTPLTPIPDPIMPIRGKRWRLMADTSSKAILKRHRLRGKTGTTAPTQTPITPT